MAIRRYGKKGARCQGRYHKGRGFVVYGALAFPYGYCTAFTSHEFKHQHPISPGPLKSPRSQGSTVNYQPSHPQASTSAKTQPPHPPLFPLLPLLTLPSIPPLIPLSPYPAPSHRQTLSRHPPPQTQKPHTGVSSPLYHPNPDPRSFRRRGRRRGISGSR